jgi:hypothetical protein
MRAIGIRTWYVGGAVYDSHTTPVADFPRDGVLVVIVYFDQEYAPGLPYRQVMHGDDTYFYNPVTGVFGHNNDSIELTIQRYGIETIACRGMWDTPENYQAAVDAAMAAETW